jgi:ABC-type nickel/cobalt efflux system permease component RcnA
MDRQHEHKEHHQKEREHQKDERKQHEHAQERQVRTIHPAWFVMLGIGLIVSAVMLWTFMF